MCMFLPSPGPQGAAGRFRKNKARGGTSWGAELLFCGSQSLPETTGTAYLPCPAVCVWGGRAGGHCGFHQARNLAKMRTVSGASQPLT